MAAIIDTLQVIIDADSRGMEATLKNAFSEISSFVKDANKNGVEWKKILTKSFTPALMTTLAATIAMALSKALSFQSAFRDAAAQSTQAFAAGISDNMGSVIAVSNETGASVEDLASAEGQLAKRFKDAAERQKILTVITRFAESQNISMADATAAAMKIFDQWNITTGDEGVNAIDALTTGMRESEFTFNEFMATVASAGPAFRDSMKFGDAVASMVTYKNESDLTKEAVINMFNAVAKAALSPKDNMTAMAAGFGDLEKISTGSKDGILLAFSAIDKKIQDSGIVTVEFGKLIGLNESDIKQLSDSGVKDLDVLKEAWIALRSEMSGATKKAFDDSISLTDRLRIGFNLFTNAIGGSKEMTILIENISAALNAVGTNIQKTGSLWDGFVLTLSDGMKLLDVLFDGLAKKAGEVLRGMGETAEVIGFNMGKALNDALIGTDKKMNNQLDETFIKANLASKLDPSEIQNLIQKGERGGLSAADILSGIGGNGSSAFNNTFNISSPQNGEKLTAEKIVEQLVKQFNTNG